MPSFEHEIVVELFRVQPELARALLGEVGVELPAGEDELGSIDLSQVTSSTYGADVVTRVRVGEGRYAAAVVVEVQLQEKKEKRWTWPVYVTALRRELSCPALLLVVAPDEKVAAWAGEPIAIGHPGFTLAPIVIGPGRVPLVTDEARARQMPELAVLSVLAHPEDKDVALAAAAGIQTLWDVAGHRAGLYYDLVWSAVSASVRTALEALMEKYEYKSDFARKYFAEGKVEGKAEGRAEGKAEGRAEGKAEGTLAATRANLVRVLTRRGFAVSPELHERIATESDLARLERWLDVAVTAASLTDVFADA